MQSFFHNYPLWSALFGIFLAQAVKIPIHYFATKQWNLGLLFSTGGMPSSHSAGVTALTTAIGLQEGVHSNWFAISFVFSIIVMFDAAGVRRHAGTHAMILNRLVDEFYHLFAETKIFKEKPTSEHRERLKELLGHQPIEVFGGGLLGIVLALLLTFVYTV